MFFDSLQFKAMECGLSALNLKQEVISHNIANIDTPDYKAYNVSFQNVLEDTYNAKNNQDSSDKLAYDFKAEISNIAEESSIVTEYIPQDENNYTVKCKIVEKTETIFEISTFAGSRDRAKQISDNWKNNANIIYPKIINLLLNGENDEKK